MLKFSPTWLSVAAGLALSWPAFGEIVVLKSGAKIEGKILEENATSITLEYRESASIVDRKTIKRADIASIEKEAPDAAPWAAIKDIKLGANSLPAAQYDDLLRPLNGFINNFPQSASVAEAKKIAEAVTAEKKRVDGGEVKIAEKWLSKDEAEKERYQINGLIALNYMRSQAAGGDLIGALNTFDQIEKNFPGAKAFPDAIELALQALPNLRTVVERAHKTLQTDAAGRLQAAPLTRSELEAAAKRDEDAGLAAMAASDRAGRKWPPLTARSSKVLAKIAEKIGTESKRLAALPVPSIRESLKVAEGARDQLAVKDLAGADAALQSAIKLWAPNEIAKRLTAELADAKLAAKEAATLAAAAAATEATAAKATPPPKEEPKKVERVAVAAPVEEEKKSFFMTLPGWITIVVVIAAGLIGLNVYNKMRQRDDDGA